MEKPKLKLGKMTGKEIATWLGISYGTYSNNPAKQLSKLNFYCSYDQSNNVYIYLDSLSYPCIMLNS